VILQDAFTVEPWNLRETHLDLDLLAQTESVFALANGHVGWRANLDEGEPHGLPGSYLNGVYESRPLPYAESAYGLPESGQEVINVTNGKLIRLFVDDEPFDVRYGDLSSHERVLDFRAGVLSRRAEWVSPAGQRVRVSSLRLVSFSQRAIAAVCYEVEPLDGQARIAVQSELPANEQLPPTGADPRVAAVLEDPLSHEYHHASGTAVLLVHRTKGSGLRVGAAMDHLIECPAPTRTECRVVEDGGLVTVATVLQPGQKRMYVNSKGDAHAGRLSDGLLFQPSRHRPPRSSRASRFGQRAVGPRARQVLRYQLLVILDRAGADDAPGFDQLQVQAVSIVPPGQPDAVGVPHSGPNAPWLIRLTRSWANPNCLSGLCRVACSAGVSCASRPGPVLGANPARPSRRIGSASSGGQFPRARPSPPITPASDALYR
jgi:hypothetical protein